jgi:hypothetical protein
LWYRFRDHFVVPVSVFSDPPATVTERDCGSALGVPRCRCDGLGFLSRRDLAPVVRWRFGAAIPADCERQEEVVRLPALGIAAPAASGDAYEAQRLGFPNCRCHQTRGNPIADEVLLGDRQSAVVVPAVVGELDLDPRNDLVRRLAENAIGGATHHLNQAG